MARTEQTTLDRVREVIDRVAPSRAAFAERIGITGDKLSKSLSGARRFTSLELALVAEAGAVTVDWLLTGHTPARPALAARAVAPSPSSPPLDERALEELAGRFTTAYDVLSLLDHDPELPALPAARPEGSPHEQGARLAETARDRLRAAGVPPLRELDLSGLTAACAQVFGVDVAVTRLPAGLEGLTWQTDSCRLVILGTHPVWTRQRFTLVHELGHVLASDAQDLLVEAAMAPGLAAEPTEIRANAFAAALLMPEDGLRADLPPGLPAQLDTPSFAALVVRHRVSPSAMAARLYALGLIDGAARDRLRRHTTAGCHEVAGAMDAYVAQSAASGAEVPPVRLVSGLFAAYRAGRSTLRPLAALLGSGVDELRSLLDPTALPEPSDAITGEPVFTP
jgi:hypothetical protein